MSDSTSGVLAIDCGQTGISWSISGGPGFLGGSGAGIDTGRPVEPQIAERVRTILDDSGAQPGVLTCGSPGLDRPDAVAMLSALRDTPIDRVALAHHSTTSYLGALGNAEGVVIACDTGVVTVRMTAGLLASIWLRTCGIMAGEKLASAIT